MANNPTATEWQFAFAHSSMIKPPPIILNTVMAPDYPPIEEQAK